MVEDSTGGTDCWLALDEKSNEELQAFLKDYAINAIITDWICQKEDED
jgi:hypothetical protein